MAPSTDPRDLYKSIELVRSLPDTFRRDRESGWTKKLAAIGECYNDLGGLFGKDNFYGETAIYSRLETLTFDNQVSLLPSGTGQFWDATLETIQGAITVTCTVLDNAPNIVVHDNQFFDSTTSAWTPRPGNVGILVQQSNGAETLTIADLEHAINAQSLLAYVVRPDANHAGVLIEETDADSFARFVIQQDRSAIQQAHDSLITSTAEGKYLTRIGSNYGVPRPPQSPFDDVLYSKIVQVLAWLPKTPLLVPYRLAEIIFGTQADLVNQFGRSWQIYEVKPNEIIFECPIELIAGNLTIASYLHGYSGTAIAATGPTNTITFVGSDVRKAANSLIGTVNVYLFFSGAWQSPYLITTATYDSTTNINTLVLNSSTVPQGAIQFYIDIPSASSFPGDHMLASASVSAGAPGVPLDRLVYLYGQGRLDIYQFYMNNFIRAAGVLLRTEVL